MRLATIVAILLALGAQASAQEEKKDEPRECKLIRAEGASFLEDCGKQLFSFTLAYDIRHIATRDQQGRFAFSCPMEPMCIGEPKVSGFFIEPEGWQKGAKDEKAIFDAFRSKVVVAWRGSADSGPPMPPSSCPAFDVAVGGLAGRAICYSGVQEKWSTIVAVAADDRVGFVLIFFQPDQDAEQLKSKVLSAAPKFTTTRATGDSGLLGWMR
jgi:hypothetical protein